MLRPDEVPVSAGIVGMGSYLDDLWLLEVDGRVWWWYEGKPRNDRRWPRFIHAA